MNYSRYLREPLWAIRAADARTAAVLLGNTVRHHVSNWLNLAGNPDTTFRANLDLGGKRPSTVTLRATAGDISILYEVFAERAYHIPAAALAPDSVRTVVDCGAHVGLTALYFAHRYPDARVIAIEPNPANFALLCANVAGEPGIVPLQACISDRSGRSRISTDGPGWSHRTGPIGVEVDALTLGDLRERFGFETIDLLKMDIEGAEKSVLGQGIGSVRAIAAELHGDYTIDKFARDMAPRTISIQHGNDTVFAL